MKNIKELGLELIELEDQVLVVDKRIQPVNNWYFDTYIKKVKNTSGAEYAKDSQVIQIISSTKPLEGLPLLVIEDYINIPEFELELEKLRFQQGYDKARQIFKFTEEDLVRAFNVGTNSSFEAQSKNLTKDELMDFYSKKLHNLIQSLTKKELWVEVENYCGSPYTTERCPKCIDSCDSAYQRPKITDGKIKTIWK